MELISSGSTLVPDESRTSYRCVGTFLSETTLFLRQDRHALIVLTEGTSDDLQQYLAGVRYQRDTPVVSTLSPILNFVEYRDEGIFPLLRPLPLLQMQTTISSSRRRKARSPLRVILNSSTEKPSDPAVFPFANERVLPVSSCIMG